MRVQVQDATSARIIVWGGQAHFLETTSDGGSTVVFAHVLTSFGSQEVLYVVL